MHGMRKTKARTEKKAPKGGLQKLLSEFCPQENSDDHPNFIENLQKQDPASTMQKTG